MVNKQTRRVKVEYKTEHEKNLKKKKIPSTRQNNINKLNFKLKHAEEKTPAHEQPSYLIMQDRDIKHEHYLCNSF